jgi:hypothetical protein
MDREMFRVPGTKAQIGEQKRLKIFNTDCTNDNINLITIKRCKSNTIFLSNNVL